MFPTAVTCHGGFIAVLVSTVLFDDGGISALYDIDGVPLQVAFHRSVTCDAYVPGVRRACEDFARGVFS